MRKLALIPLFVTTIKGATDECLVCSRPKVGFFRLENASGRRKSIVDILWSLFQIKIECGDICRSCCDDLQSLHKIYENMKTQLLRNSDLRHEEQTPSYSSHSLNDETGIGKLSAKQSEQESRSICNNLTVHKECTPLPTKMFLNLCNQPLLDENNPMTSKWDDYFFVAKSKEENPAVATPVVSDKQNTGDVLTNEEICEEDSIIDVEPLEDSNSDNKAVIDIKPLEDYNSDNKAGSEKENAEIEENQERKDQVKFKSIMKAYAKLGGSRDNKGHKAYPKNAPLESGDNKAVIDIKPLQDSNSDNKTGSEKENTEIEKNKERNDRMKFESIMKAYPKLAPLRLGDNREKQKSIDNKRYKLCIDGSEMADDKQTIAEDHSYTLLSKETVQKVVVHFDSEISINHSDDDCNDPPEEESATSVTRGAVNFKARWASVLESLSENSIQETDCVKCSKYFRKSNTYLLYDVILDVFQWRSILNENLEEEEGIKRKKSLECKYCGLQLLVSFPVFFNQELYVHICSICKIGTTKGAEYELHMSTVHSLKLNTCKYCNEKFALFRNLVVHVKKCHTGDRNYVCSKCGKKYVARYELRRHVDFVHRKIRPYVCKCGASYGRRYLLKQHQANKVCTQTIKTCNLCKQDFQTSKTMNMHMKTEHPETMPYLCRFCGKGFSVKRLLHNHEHNHVDGIKGFQKKCPEPIKVVLCEICGKAIRGERGLKKHLKLHNRNGSLYQDKTNLTNFKPLTNIVPQLSIEDVTEVVASIKSGVM